jgi:hypothetical protein
MPQPIISKIPTTVWISSLGRDRIVTASKITRATFSQSRPVCLSGPAVSNADLFGSDVMGFLYGQNGLVRTSFDAKQTAFTVFRPLDAGMTMKAETHFSKNKLRADLHTCPAGLTAAGIQADKRGLLVMQKGEMKFHFLLL